MIYITSYSDITGKEHHTEWQIGERDMTASNRGEITVLQADGPELSLILSTIKGIRTAEWASRVIWTGEDAKFIYWNLRQVPNT